MKATHVHLLGGKERYAAALRGSPPPDDAVRETTTTDLAQVASRSKKLSDWFSGFAKGDLDLERIIERVWKRDRRIAELSAIAGQLAPEAGTAPAESNACAPRSYLVFAQLEQRYALVECNGALPEPNVTLELPGVRAARSGGSHVGRLPPRHPPRGVRRQWSWWGRVGTPDSGHGKTAGAAVIKSDDEGVADANVGVIEPAGAGRR